MNNQITDMQSRIRQAVRFLNAIEYNWGNPEMKDIMRIRANVQNAQSVLIPLLSNPPILEQQFPDSFTTKYGVDTPSEYWQELEKQISPPI